MLLYLIVGVVTYLLGSIPFGLILVRLFRKQDIRQQGSGNIGATNVIRSGGKGLGAATFLLDAAKGFAAVIATYMVASQLHMSRPAAQDLAATAALCAIVGHIYTVWLGFKGGKGVATGFGVFLAISPVAALISLAVFILVFAISRFVSLGSILASITFAVLALLRGYGKLTPWLLAVCAIVPLIVIVKHHANIRRLLTGTEYRFGRSKAAAA
jgi:acyl phosphate:glycerol-3-phosphate acyltransferase